MTSWSDGEVTFAPGPMGDLAHYRLQGNSIMLQRGGYVANGDLQLMDLDLDKVNEIVVSFDSYKDPLIEQRLGEVIVRGESGFESVWTGPLEYDATKAARTVPPERRDRFKRDGRP